MGPLILRKLGVYSFEVNIKRILVRWPTTSGPPSREEAREALPALRVAQRDPAGGICHAAANAFLDFEDFQHLNSAELL